MVLGTHNLGVHGDILVVDDETAVVEVVALYLRRDGFDVRVAMTAWRRRKRSMKTARPGRP